MKKINFKNILAKTFNKKSKIKKKLKKPVKKKTIIKKVTKNKIDINSNNLSDFLGIKK